MIVLTNIKNFLIHKIDHGSINFGVHVSKGSKADSKEVGGQSMIGDHHHYTKGNNKWNTLKYKKKAKNRKRSN
ncbi:hypothetical protein [Bacillus horti]|uniref:Uncharacterized protein n=1 Tax=Caldalkalibacillus horti TaxID=77523 RepID=A0ABT9VXU2_9BACI|nr:hypothetical protein [Bacillus horti]MDQ0165798.1 hypothetical protein [Bacillus horti]